ncbi:IS66 family insertion sequence element accessory protein TnpB, partial [Escherichia coli]
MVVSAIASTPQVAGITDMRNGFNGLASKVQNVLKDDPFSGHLFIFRGR